MKYIKLFEKLKYKVGDYIKMKEVYPLEHRLYYYAKIVEIINFTYIVKYITNSGEASDNFWIGESLIERYLTPEEIEDFKTKIEASKYNL